MRVKYGFKIFRFWKIKFKIFKTHTVYANDEWQCLRLDKKFAMGW